MSNQRYKPCYCAHQKHQSQCNERCLWPDHGHDGPCEAVGCARVPTDADKLAWLVNAAPKPLEPLEALREALSAVDSLRAMIRSYEMRDECRRNSRASERAANKR